MTSGNLLHTAGAGTPNLYLYTGEQFDPDLGMYYLRARYMDPADGRFWTRDTFEGFKQTPVNKAGTKQVSVLVDNIRISRHTELGKAQFCPVSCPSIFRAVVRGRRSETEARVRLVEVRIKWMQTSVVSTSGDKEFVPGW